MSRIDVEKLLEEISPDMPSGEEKNVYELDKMSRPETDPDGEILSEPKWRDVQNAAVDLLGETHDLRVAVILTRALIDRQGFAGFCDGLSLIRGYLEQHWETVYPLLDPDDGDPGERISAIWELTDYERFIDPIKRIPLCLSNKMGKYGLRDIHIANGTLKPVKTNEDNDLPKLDVIEAAFMDSDSEKLREIQIAARDTLEGIEQLDALLVEKVGTDDAIPFNDLTRTVKEINKVLSDHIGEIPEPVSESEAEEETESEPDPGVEQQVVVTRPVAPGTVTSRQDVIRMLDRICEYYIKKEPTSPVPLLLNRAKRLVDKNFIEILEDMAPAGVEQVESLFGRLPEPEPEPEAEPQKEEKES